MTVTYGEGSLACPPLGFALYTYQPAFLGNCLFKVYHLPLDRSLVWENCMYYVNHILNKR